MYISGAYTPLQKVVIIYDAFIGGTERNRSGRKTDEIAKFRILDGKNGIHNFGRNFDEKNGQMTI